MSTLATQETDLPLAPFVDGLTPAYRKEEARCLYIKKLVQVDMAIVESLIKKALKQYEKSS